MSTCSREASAGRAWSWAAGGASKARVNQSRTAGENWSSATLPAYGPPQHAPAPYVLTLVPVLSVVIALLAAPTPVSSYGGRVAFSEQGSGGENALVTPTAAGAQPLPLPPPRVPFDGALR